jgi:large subunit ribosomal protein L47
MARIKAVINERRLAYEGALRIAEEKKQEHLDHIVLQHQKAGFNKDRAYLARRRAYMEQKLAKKRAARKAMVAAANTAEDSAPVENIEKVEVVETIAEEKDATPLSESAAPEETVKVEVVETVTEVKPAPKDTSANKTASPQPRVNATPEVTQADRPAKGESASEAATAGLFGNSASGRRSR